MDLTTIIGLIIGIGAILGGQVLEGGHISSIAQPTAALIVLGGTVGAVVLSFPGKKLKLAMKGLKTAFSPPKQNPREIISSLSSMAAKARREGLVSLEKDAESLSDPFLRKGLRLAIDGMSAASIRLALELEVTAHEEEAEVPAKVFESAGGYAPTIGIIGAVLGLIHVMGNLSDPSKLGAGIAVAFVATVYGVGFANLVCLPLSTKLKQRARERGAAMEMITEGVAALADGDNPRNIEEKLRGMHLDAGEGHA
jgi:chemotaxis protein MotA